MIYIPILGAFFLASLTIAEKFVLRKRKIDIKFFHVVAFLGAVITMLPLLYFFWKLDPQALELKNVLIFAGVIVSSILANLLMFYAIKGDKISNIEPAIIMEPLFTVLLAVIFSFFTVGLFERDFGVIIPALVAAIALVLSHIKKHHFKFGKYFVAALFGAFFFALELIVSRLILDFYTPISFYFFRCLFVMLVSMVIFMPKVPKIKTKVNLEILGIGSLWVAYRVLVYYGFLTLGVIFTTLMIMLGPVFVYLLAWKFLKEKISWRNIVASIVIVMCVAYAVFI